jgi:protein gp37
VSAGCKNCYAETLSGRNPDVLGVWGPNGTRVVAAEAQWRLPVRWNGEAAGSGERRRVFCASLADVFEDWSGIMVNAGQRQLYVRPSGEWIEEPIDDHREYVGCRPLTMDDVRRRLFELIAVTPYLDWLLLTKRPQNITPTLERLRAAGLVASNHFPWDNVWLGTTVEDQDAADARIPELLKVPAKVRFLSCEPLLGEVDLRSPAWNGRANGLESVGIPRHLAADVAGTFAPLDGIHWVIVGGESGGEARPFDLAWARSLVRQCRDAGTACFVKQLGSDPHAWKPSHEYPSDGATLPLRLRDRKGGDPAEWPEDLRVRDFPAVEG